MFAYIIVYSILVISCGFDTAKIALNKKINILLGLVCLLPYLGVKMGGWYRLGTIFKYISLFGMG